MHIAYLGETTSLVPFSPLQWLHGSPVTYFHDVCGGAGSSRQESSGSSQHTDLFQVTKGVAQAINRWVKS